MRSGSIIIADANGIEQEMSLSRGQLRVGSAPDNDLVIAGPDIAPYHALISYDDRERLVVAITDENIIGQGGMRLTFNLAQAARRRDLAWIGDYVLSYQPPRSDSRTQPLSPVATPMVAPAERQSADDIDLLHALLDQTAGAAYMSATPDAITVEMPLLALTVSA
jgi:hypothetical protein